MRKVLIFTILVMTLHGVAFAYIEKTDVVLCDQENAVYMIGSVFNRLTWSDSPPKKDAFRIYKIQLPSNNKMIFYEGDKPLDRLKISPDNKYVSVIKRHGYSYLEIAVFDRKLKVEEFSIKERDGILEYVWSPDGKKIAYMAGTLGERGKINLKGIVVYDLEKEEKKRIEESAIGIEWLPTGELCLYEKYLDPRGGDRVTYFKTLIYDDVKSKIVDQKKGIYLSQDGRYSADPKYYMLPQDQKTDKVVVDFVDLKKNELILGQTLSNVFSDPMKIAWGGEILWLKGGRLVVLRRISKSMYYDISICNIENNRTLMVFRGKIVGVNGDRSVVVNYFDGKLAKIIVP